LSHWRAAGFEALRAGRPAADVEFLRGVPRSAMLECAMVDITRSYRIRAYPNGAQRCLLDRWFGGIRWLWNTTLEIRSAAYRECGLTLTGNDLSRWLTQWKRTSGHEWLAQIPATALTQCLRDQDSALRNFFAQRARYPRFKRKQRTDG